MLAMIQSKIRVFLCGWLAAVCMFITPNHVLAASGEITVLADGALTRPLIQIARIYSRSSGDSISIINNRQQSHEKRIRGGLPVDVVITADAVLQSSLRLAGQVDQIASSRILSDPWVMAMQHAPLSLGHAASIQSMLQTAQAPKLVVLASYQSEISVPETIIEEAQKTKEVVQVADMPSLISTLSRTGGYSILTRSQSRQAEGLRTVSTISHKGKEQAVHYDALVIASNQMNRARMFAAFLKTPQAQEVFASFGFTSPTP